MGKAATQLPDKVFEHIQMNAGILMSEFDPQTWTITATNIIGATSGGINFSDTPSFTDYGEDIDNCPKNTKELKELDSREIKVSGTYVAVTAEQIKNLAAAADIDTSKATITPRTTLTDADFADIWFVGDYGKGGFIAINIKNALSTGGFNLQTTDKAKGTFSFEYTAHYSLENPDEVPYKVYVKAGGE